MLGLREIRKKKGLSQVKVAMDLNISREALSYYENGKRNPDLQMLRLLSEYFDVSIDYLINGRDFVSKRQKESPRCFASWTLHFICTLYQTFCPWHGLYQL